MNYRQVNEINLAIKQLGKFQVKWNNEKWSSNQMKELRLAALSNIDYLPWFDTSINFHQMEQFRLAAKSGVDYTHWLGHNYSEFSLFIRRKIRQFFPIFFKRNHVTPKNSIAFMLSTYNFEHYPNLHKEVIDLTLLSKNEKYSESEENRMLVEHIINSLKESDEFKLGKRTELLEQLSSIINKINIETRDNLISDVNDVIGIVNSYL